MKKVISFLILLTAMNAFAQQTPVFKNLDNVQEALGFQNFYQNGVLGRTVKVAVFDHGFDGYAPEIGKSLPANTKYSPGPIQAPPDASTDHGLRMAQIFTALATNNLQNPSVISQFYLYNVFGFSNFKAAVDDAIARKIDVILYSEVWQYGGNNDGTGFINAQASRATAAGIIWVNAVGNFNQTTYNSGIQTVADDWVKMPDQNNGLALRCEQNDSNKCVIKAVLEWNDFKNDITPGTNKDLDFALFDDMMNVLETSALRQSADPNESRPGYSKYSREIIGAELKPGLYFFKVKNFSKNFTAKDHLRISVDGNDLSMPSHSVNESVLNPADNPSVISVGAFDSDLSSISLSMNKPDIMAPSSMILQDGSEFRGSSNANAIVAAGAALLIARDGNLNRTELLGRMSRSYDWDRGALSLQVLGFGPEEGGDCFTSREWEESPEYLKPPVVDGAVFVNTTLQYRLMVPFDPITIAPGLRRTLYNDQVVVSTDGQYRVYARGALLPQGSVEIFQRPLEMGLCQVPAKRKGRLFSLESH